MGKRKPFIDKKKAVTFELVHRSQRDPRIFDENAPERVLRPTGQAGADYIEETYRREDFEKEPMPEDGYDYEQHMRIAGGGVYVPRVLDEEKPSGSIQFIPSEVFASEHEEEEGLGNRAALPPSLAEYLNIDPDILEALNNPEEGDFDELEDDFIALASKPGAPGDDNDSDYTDTEGSGDEDSRSDLSDMDNGFGAKKLPPRADGGHSRGGSRHSEGRSYVTTDTHTGVASVIDEKFEKVIEDYSDDEMGSLDGDEETRGEHTLDEFQNVLDDYLTKEPGFRGTPLDQVQYKGESASAILSRTTREEYEYVRIPLKADFDCETVMSYQTNTENIPQLIREESSKPQKIRVSAKTGIPLGVLPTKAPKEKESRENLGVGRKKEETPEEKRERKAQIKEEKKQRREQKKSNTIMYKSEELKLQRMAVAQPHRGASVMPLQ